MQKREIGWILGYISVVAAPLVTGGMWPGADWPGARGWINEEILRKHLPENYRKLDYFVCGPAAMMDAMEELLQRIGVAAGRIHTERFEMV